MNPISPPRRARSLPLVAGLSGALLLCACASAPPAPSANLQEARHAIATADQAQAGRYAPSDLSAARAKLASADAAVSAGRMIAAQRFADESTADAELATARTQDLMANAVNDETKRNTATLIEELQRSSGDSQ